MYNVMNDFGDFNYPPCDEIFLVPMELQKSRKVT